MKSIEEMEETVDTITAYMCTGLIIVLFLCIFFFGLQALIGFLVAISMGG